MKNLNLVFLLMVWIEVVFCDNFFSKFYQHDYKIKDVRFDVVNYNKKLVNRFDVRTSKYNRTNSATNVTYSFKIAPKNNIEVIVQAYKFLSNEYRIFPAVRRQFNVCLAFNANIGGNRDQLLKCGNVTDCNTKANVTYHICNFVIDESRFPPYVPNGRFMLQMKFLFIEEFLLEINGYAEIYRPIPYPKK